MEFVLLTAGKAALLLLAALTACRIASGAPATLRHAVCLASLLGSACLPILQAVLPAIEIGALTAARSPLTGGAPGPGGLTIALGIVWILGAMFVGLRLVRGIVSTAHTVRRAEPVRDAGILSAALLARRELRCRLPIHVGVLGGVSGPMSFGLLRHHAILLPAAAHGWSRSRLRAVFLHEMAHLARRDCLTQTIAGITCAIYWFLPPAWWALRRMCVEREIACDDRVVSLGARPSGYASFLVDSFRRFREGDPVSAAAASVGGREELERRVGAVLSTERRRGTLGRLRLAVALGAVGLVIPLAAVRGGPPPLRKVDNRVHMHAFASSRAAAFAGSFETNSGRR